jgi:hypothetical protein
MWPTGSSEHRAETFLIDLRAKIKAALRDNVKEAWSIF